MKRPVLVILSDGEDILINEDQICSVHQWEKGAKLRMSNGDEHFCKAPSYNEWKNDYHIRDDSA